MSMKVQLWESEDHGITSDINTTPDVGPGSEQEAKSAKMSRSVGGEEQGGMWDINRTPLCDVMLVLLVTLIMSLPIQTHAVKLDMPPPIPNQPPPDIIPEVIN